MNLPATTAGKTGWATRPDAKQRGKTQITHDAIIDFIMANPTMTNKEIAEFFGYREPTSISIIVNSDAFKARFESRKEELLDPILRVTIDDRIRALSAKSSEILMRKLETTDDGQFALKVFEASSRAGGYGLPKNAPVIQQQFVVGLPGPAASSAEWMNKFAHSPPPARPEVEDVEPKGG
jgi:hypothetical protein